PGDAARVAHRTRATRTQGDASGAGIRHVEPVAGDLGRSRPQSHRPDRRSDGASIWRCGWPLARLPRHPDTPPTHRIAGAAHGATRRLPISICCPLATTRHICYLGHAMKWYWVVVRPRRRSRPAVTLDNMSSKARILRRPAQPYPAMATLNSVTNGSM